MMTQRKNSFLILTKSAAAMNNLSPFARIEQIEETLSAAEYSFFRGEMDKEFLRDELEEDSPLAVYLHTIEEIVANKYEFISVMTTEEAKPFLVRFKDFSERIEDLNESIISKVSENEDEDKLMMRFAYTNSSFFEVINQIIKANNTYLEEKTRQNAKNLSAYETFLKVEDLSTCAYKMAASPKEYNFDFYEWGPTKPLKIISEKLSLIDLDGLLSKFTNGHDSKLLKKLFSESCAIFDLNFVLGYYENEAFDNSFSCDEDLMRMKEDYYLTWEEIVSTYSLLSRLRDIMKAAQDYFDMIPDSLAEQRATAPAESNKRSAEDLPKTEQKKQKTRAKTILRFPPLLNLDNTIYLFEHLKDGGFIAKDTTEEAFLYTFGHNEGSNKKTIDQEQPPITWIPELGLLKVLVNCLITTTKNRFGKRWEITIHRFKWWNNGSVQEIKKKSLANSEIEHTNEDLIKLEAIVKNSFPQATRKDYVRLG